jgi:prepilin-type N-terminal cleavage/methylation domain-containing protein
MRNYQTVGSKLNTAPLFFRPRYASTLNPQPSTFNLRWAFTLVELLVVISIIGVLAALLLPVAGVVKRNSMIHTAQAEMAQLETAIDRYKSAYGFYPPDNPGNLLINQLYYELGGTTNIALPAAAPDYQSLDNASVQLTSGQVSAAFGVGSFINCSKPGADESSPQARDFLPDLKPDQIGAATTPSGVAITNLVTSVGGPDATYKPLGQQDVNPWRYNSSSPANNRGSYDLWVQLSIGEKTNLICNWNDQVQINNPLP